MLADLYLLPNTTTPYRYVNNGSCVSNLKLYPAALRAEDPCIAKVTPKVTQKSTAKSSVKK